MTAIFMLREIDGAFNITKELRMVVILSVVFEQAYLGFLLFFGDSLFVILGIIEYLQIALCIGLMYYTAIQPLLATYKPSSIIPFSLNKECIANVESAMIQETSSKFFYNFLTEDLKDERGVILFALYSDLRRFMVILDSPDTSKEELMNQAKQIYKDYILDGADFQLEQNEIVKELRAGYNSRADMIMLPVNEALFQSLILFAAGGLEIYYNQFMESQRFEDLQIEVDKQEILYNVLRRYQLISN